MTTLATDLQASFIKRYSNQAGHGFKTVPKLAEADGVMFLCPKCFAEDPPGPVGTHAVICWFAGKVPDDVDPKPGRWTPSGTGLSDLTFVPGEPTRAVSVQINGGCEAHFNVVGGQAL